MDFTPEEQLLIAVLRQGFKDRTRDSVKIRRQANRWFEQDSDELFSYKMICEWFGLSPGTLKKLEIAAYGERDHTRSSRIAFNRILFTEGMRKKKYG